ncbi:hypothetical protein RUM43_002360 [Polyplax serrata]|uniref:Uncharacterized protein n=1 Tax=Polyplax serrata TaxID=468196 RepID=A0AAN8NUH4_POLSC
MQRPEVKGREIPRQNETFFGEKFAERDKFIEKIKKGSSCRGGHGRNEEPVGTNRKARGKAKGNSSMTDREKEREKKRKKLFSRATGC